MDIESREKTKRSVEKYLHEKGMHHEDADFDELIEGLEKEIQSGLDGKDSSLAMIPTFIEAKGEVPTDTPVPVLDAGGTNFRTALITFDREGTPRIDKYFKYPMPGSEGYVGKDQFFDNLAEKTANVYGSAGRIGFCFSYPTEIYPDRDGRLLHFSKEIKAPEVEGEYIGYNLKNALARAGASGDIHIVILNDTVATLLAAQTLGSTEDYETYIGFILGTGLNCAYIEHSDRIGKLSSNPSCESQIVNMETGGYKGYPGGQIDEEFDRTTKSPGHYRMEKMVSGAYLGPLAGTLLRRAALDGVFSRETAAAIEKLSELSTIRMDNFLHAPQKTGRAKGSDKTAGPDKQKESGGPKKQDKINADEAAMVLADVFHTEEDRLAGFILLDNIIERAGKLAAINISAAVLQSDSGHTPTKPAAVCVDGTTFYKTHRLRFYTEYYLKKELEERRGRHVELLGVDNAPIIGAAVAGLTN